MNLDEFLERTNNLLYASGDACDFGCSPENLRDMKNYVKANFPSRPCCAVSDWMWIDLDIPRREQYKFSDTGVTPQYIWAKNIIEDESGRRWNSVRTSELAEFHKNCIFLTRQTAYILVGPGMRKSASWEAFYLTTF